MRNWALRKSPHFRCSPVLLIVLLLSLALTGCGGGGGGGNPGGGNPGGGGATTATVTGRVVSHSDGTTGVGGVTIQVAGTNITATTETDPTGTHTGNFQLLNVPVSATGITINTTPAGFTSYAYVLSTVYGYDPTTGAHCVLPLPSLTGGGSKAFGQFIQLVTASDPPPPPANCP